VDRIPFSRALRAAHANTDRPGDAHGRFEVRHAIAIERCDVASPTPPLAGRAIAYDIAVPASRFAALVVKHQTGNLLLQKISWNNPMQFIITAGGGAHENFEE
jgi:hypothetical protein